MSTPNTQYLSELESFYMQANEITIGLPLEFADFLTCQAMDRAFDFGGEDAALELLAGLVGEFQTSYSSFMERSRNINGSANADPKYLVKFETSQPLSGAQLKHVISSFDEVLQNLPYEDEMELPEVVSKCRIEQA